MNTKLNNLKSRMVLLTNGLPTDLNHQQGLRNILLSTSKPTRYIVTLRPRTNLKNQKNSGSETQKLFINSDDILKGKSMFDIKFIAPTKRLETIDEQSENSATSIVSVKYDLKIAKSKANINRLRGGWGKGQKRLSKKKSTVESKSNITGNNGQAGPPKENGSSRESIQSSLNKDTYSILVNTDVIIKKEDKQQQEIFTYTDRVEENVNKELHITTNNNDIKESIELEPADSDKKIELKRSNIGNNDLPTSSTETEKSARALITSSFIENALAEIIPLTEKQTLPSSSIKCEIKDLIPICGKSLSSQTQCDLLDINPKEAALESEIFCMLQCDEETCKRIENLENQVQKLNSELKDLQKDLVPIDDLVKLNVISRHFNEVNDLLTDLKQNCLKLQNIELQKDEARESDTCTCFDMCNCGIYQCFPSENEKIVHECNYRHEVSPSEHTQKSNFINCSHCVPVMQQSSVYETPKYICDFSTPKAHIGCNYCNYCQFYTEVNAKQQYSSSKCTSYPPKKERAEIDRYVTTDWNNSPENSQRKVFNGNTPQISNEQNNNVQKPSFKGNPSKLKEHNTRNSAGRDNLLSSINKETKTNSNITVKDSVAELPITTNNLCQEIWKIIGNNFQLTSKYCLKPENNLTKQIQSTYNKSCLKGDINKDRQKNMSDPNETYTRIQSVRVKNLEQQINLMYGELQRIREGMLTHRDLMRLGNLLERLRELNAILVELRNHYMQQSAYGNGENTLYRWGTQQGRDSNGNIVKCNENTNESQKHSTNFVMCENPGKYIWSDKDEIYYPRENAGYDQRESSDTTQHLENIEERLLKQDSELKVLKEENKDVTNAPFKTCKQLMDEIKPPGSILGNYLIRLQDFRTDPELKRQRWERKQQEKLQKLQKRKYIMGSLEDKGTSTEVLLQNKADNLNEKRNSSSSKTDSSLIENDGKELIKRITDVNFIKPKSETDSGLVLDLPLIKSNLSEVVYEITNDIDKDAIALTIVLENDLVYHISVFLISSGHSLSCFLATDEAIQEAKRQHLFQDILTFFVVNAEYSEEQKDRILGHSFEFMKMDLK